MDKRNELKKRRIIFALVWVLSLVLISFYGGPVSYGFFYAATLLPILSFLYVILVFFFFKTYQELESRNVVCGQPVPYLFVLRNEGFYPFSGIKVRLYSFFSYVENMDEDTEYEVLRGDKYIFQTNLVCKYRGEYEVGIKEVEVTDFLRLFCLRYKVRSTLSVVVKPKISDITQLTSVEDMMGVMQRSGATAHAEPDVLTRDYRPGDPMHRISWKMSAREQKLKVRLQTGEEKQGIVLLGDTKRYYKEIKEYLPLESKMLEIMVSLGHYMATNNMPFTACFGQGGQGLFRVEGIRDFEAYYRAVSDVWFREEDRLAVTMKTLLDNGMLLRSKLIFGVLHEMNDEIMYMTIQLSDAGIPVIWYVVTQEDCLQYIKQSNERRKIIVIPVEAQPDGRL